MELDKVMFSINIPKDLYDKITDQTKKEGRSRNKQVIYWLKLGILLDSNPDIKRNLLLKEQLQ